MHPVKDTRVNESRRLLSCSDTRVCTRVVCTRCVLLVRKRVHGAPFRLLPVVRERQPASDFLQARHPRGFSRVCRDTSDRLLPPKPPDDLHPRSRFSISTPKFLGSVRNEELTFHDVQARFGSITTVRRGVVHPVCSFDFDDDRMEASDTPVARPLLRAALSGDLTRCSNGPRPRAPYPREEIRRRDDPRCLPSVGRSGFRTFRRSRWPCEPPPRGGLVRRSIVISLEAPGQRCLAASCPGFPPELSSRPHRVALSPLDESEGDAGTVLL